LSHANVRQAGIQRDEQVETFLLPDLADDDPRGPHPQRLLDQAPELDLAGAFEVGLAGLHRHHVGQVDLEREPWISTLVCDGERSRRVRPYQP